MTISCFEYGKKFKYSQTLYPRNMCLSGCNTASRRFGGLRPEDTINNMLISSLFNQVKVSEDSDCRVDTFRFKMDNDELRGKVIDALSLSMRGLVLRKNDLIMNRSDTYDMALPSSLYRFMQGKNPKWKWVYGTEKAFRRLAINVPKATDAVLAMTYRDTGEKKLRVPIRESSLMPGIVLLEKLADTELISLMPDTDNIMTLYPACVALVDRFFVADWEYADFCTLQSVCRDICLSQSEKDLWAQLLQTIISWLRWNEFGADHIKVQDVEIPALDLLSVNASPCFYDCPDATFPSSLSKSGKMQCENGDQNGLGTRKSEHLRFINRQAKRNNKEEKLGSRGKKDDIELQGSKRLATKSNLIVSDDTVSNVKQTASEAPFCLSKFKEAAVSKMAKIKVESPSGHQKNVETESTVLPPESMPIRIIKKESNMSVPSSYQTVAKSNMPRIKAEEPNKGEESKIKDNTHSTPSMRTPRALARLEDFGQFMKEVDDEPKSARALRAERRAQKLK